MRKHTLVGRVCWGLSSGVRCDHQWVGSVSQHKVLCGSIAIEGARKRIEQSLNQVFIALDEANALEMVQTQLGAGQDVFEIIEQCRLGITGWGGALRTRRVVFIGVDHGWGNIFEQCMVLMEPYPEADRTGPPLWTVVIGTLKGDIQDLDKHIVIALPRSDAFEVIDLGLEPLSQEFTQGGKQNSGQ